MAEPNRRHRQIANAIRDELVTIARKDISDPQLERVGMVTFSGVELTEDLRNGTVWVAFMGKDEKAKDVQGALEALNRSAKFIHRLLIKRLPMKVHPHLQFKFDRGFDRAAVVGKALSEAAEVEKRTQEERAANPEESDKGET
ncbi:MAG TPA: 30S ribosome-binding factor RbfA [Bdellovibrionota bacterium]|jgi:ribosome-binding factor A